MQLQNMSGEIAREALVLPHNHVLSWLGPRIALVPCPADPQVSVGPVGGQELPQCA